MFEALKERLQKMEVQATTAFHQNVLSIFGVFHSEVADLKARVEAIEQAALEAVEPGTQDGTSAAGAGGAGEPE